MQVEQLQALLASTTRELEELQFDPDPAKPFLGMAVSQKVNGTVPDNLRDLAVNLGVFQGMPGHTVFEAMAMVTEGHGARVINRVQNSGAMFLHCLVERAIILEDDQAKRIGEELLPANDDGTRQELTVRASAPTDEDEALDQQAESKYDKGVMDKLDSWINKRDYKPKDCPLPGSVDVGSLASALDILGLSLVCAFLWMGVDGTTHGRNDREELGLNIGGYRGAPDSGEFGTLIKQILNLLAIELYKVSQSLIISSMCRYIGTIMENHTGQSGPRTELLEIMGWFTRLRKRQRLLGFKEELLDLELFSTIDFVKESSWTVARLQNQLKLRNLHKDRRSEQVRQLFTEADESDKLFGRGDMLLTSGNRAPLIARLERVLKLEERASRREDDDRRRDAADLVQAARDSRSRRTRRAPSHRHPGER